MCAEIELVILYARATTVDACIVCNVSDRILESYRLNRRLCHLVTKLDNTEQRLALVLKF